MALHVHVFHFVQLRLLLIDSASSGSRISRVLKSGHGVETHSDVHDTSRQLAVSRA